MVDRQKIIKGLECCKEACAIGGCPYWNGSIIDGSCMLKLHADAISMLKEQEPEEPIRMHHTEHKQTDNYRCRKCGNDLYFEQRFCEACGCEVKWDG